MNTKHKSSKKSVTKYIQIRHWDYWQSVYGFTDAPASGAEFSITDDAAGEQFFFHIELYTMPALEQFLMDADNPEDCFLEKDDVSFPYFQECAARLRQGTQDYFVGGLYYNHYWPDLSVCNEFQQKKTGIFSIKSPQSSPYYAILFIREEKNLLPDLLTRWMEQLSASLFCCSFHFEIADIPSREETRNAYLPFQNS